ncbi:MAG: hypothetical protein EAX96_09565 [Candidatus Lokiarchaeota archaeon]|nr:hypothetical protein [Candidatus Lokiarchaeota archaeon]
MRNGLSLREIIKKVIEGNLDYQVRFKKSNDYSTIFENLEDIEIIEEIIESISPENYYKIPDRIKKSIIKNSKNKNLVNSLTKYTTFNKNQKDFTIWGLKSLINSMSSELYWALTKNHRDSKIQFEQLIFNIKNDALDKFDIDKKLILKNLDSIPHFYESDEIQKKILLIGEILKIIEKKYDVSVPFNKKFKSFLLKAKIYGDLLSEKFNGSKLFIQRIEKLLKYF